MLYQATLADTAVMATVHAAAFPARDAWSRDVFSLQLAIPGVFGLLHRAGGMLLARVAADEAEILTVAVVPHARRGGVGTALLRRAARVAGEMGARLLFLEVSVANMAARQVYARTGFIEVGRRPAYYSDRSDAIVLRLDLKSGS
jgi:ribosomal-protein-alanine N-acetyltransferase